MADRFRNSRYCKMFGSGDPNIHFTVVPSVASAQLGTSNEGFESHDSNNVRRRQIECLRNSFSQRWHFNFGGVDIASCFGQETKTVHWKFLSNPRRNT